MGGGTGSGGIDYIPKIKQEESPGENSFLEELKVDVNKNKEILEKYRSNIKYKNLN